MADSDDELFGAEHVRVYRETKGARGYDWRQRLEDPAADDDRAHVRRAAHDAADPRRRRRPLGRHRVQGRGATTTPAWYKNLAADAEATVEVLADEVPVVANTVEGEERARLWSAMTEEWPAYDDYQAKTDREIPVVVLAPR